MEFMKGYKRKLPPVVRRFTENYIMTLVTSPGIEGKARHYHNLIKEASKKFVQPSEFTTHRTFFTQATNHVLLIKPAVLTLNRIAQRMGAKVLITGRDGAPPALIAHMIGMKYRYEPLINRDNNSITCTDCDIFFDTGFSGTIWKDMMREGNLRKDCKLILLSTDNFPYYNYTVKCGMPHGPNLRSTIVSLEDQIPQFHDVLGNPYEWETFDHFLTYLTAIVETFP